MKLVEILSTNEKILSIGDIVSDKNTSHSYIDYFYENEFSKYKNKSISFLEIGINNGSCFEMWRNYFTKAKKIVGVDIREDFVLPVFKYLDGVTYYFCDAYNESFVKTLPKFDIIIDDGSHLLDHQIRFIELYLDHLNSGGVMVVEDIAVENYSNAKDKLISLVEEIEGISYEWLDFRKIKNRDDDILMVIRKK